MPADACAADSLTLIPAFHAEPIPAGSVETQSGQNDHSALEPLIPKGTRTRRGNLAKIQCPQEFANLIPPPSAAERKVLEHTLALEGCREPLVVWRRGEQQILLIGYDVLPWLRFRRATFRVIDREFATADEARMFVIRYHLQRQTLSPLAASYFRGLR
jgi:hypothetical protein